MKRKSFIHTAMAVAMTTTCLTGGTALAETDIMGGKAVVSGEINAGAQQKIIDGSREKFEEYRDVNNGFEINDFRLKVEGTDSPYYLDARIKNPVQENESYRLNAGSHGKYNLGIFHDSIPHNFSRGVFLLNETGKGRFEINDVVQQQLQANEILRNQRLTYPTPAGLTPVHAGGITSTAAGSFINPADAQNLALDAPAIGIVDNLYRSANTIKFGLKRENSGASFDFRPFDGVKAWAKVSNEKRTGNRRINQGTYERYNNGANGLPHIIDFFTVAGIEVPETIDYRTTSLTAGTGIYRKQWLADVEYTFTNFENRVHSLVWDNPFRLTSATATAANGTTFNDPFNRGRSALGQLTLSPDSQSHDISVSGSVELPLHSRFTGTISYGWINQDDVFDPYSLNSAISGIPVAPITATSINTGPGFDVTNVANLPQRNLDAKVATLFQSYQLSSKPVDPLTVTARYRYYDYDNQTGNITFPGYSAFGDSYWRPEKNNVTGGQDALVRNEALSYTRQNAELILDYHLMKPLTVSLEGFWEGWDREQLRIDGTDEYGAGAGFLFKPVKAVTLKGNYRYAHRTVDGYKPGNTAENPEAPGLINYDWAQRVRHKADLRFNVIPVEALTIGISGQYVNDHFGGDNRFGLKRNVGATGAIDVGYTFSPAFSMNANYVKEYRKSFMKSSAKDDAFNSPTTTIDDSFATDNFNPLNYWNSDIYQKVDSFGVGATVQVIPGKLTVNANYTMSYSTIDVNTYNPNGPVKLANAAAQDWPKVKDRFQEVKADIGYNFTRNLKAGVTYLYEWYKLDDFVNTQAYMAGVSAENSTRYVFTGANNFNYDAHVAAAYVSYKF